MERISQVSCDFCQQMQTMTRNTELYCHTDRGIKTYGGLEKIAPWGRHRDHDFHALRLALALEQRPKHDHFC